jgi:hypothetical protein
MSANAPATVSRAIPSPPTSALACAAKVEARRPIDPRRHLGQPLDDARRGAEPHGLVQKQRFDRVLTRLSG